MGDNKNIFPESLDFVKCTRCRNKHKYGDRIGIRSKKDDAIIGICCPCCKGHVFITCEKR